MANFHKFFLSFRGKTRIFLVSDSDFTVRVLPLEPILRGKTMIQANPPKIPQTKSPFWRLIPHARCPAAPVEHTFNPCFTAHSTKNSESKNKSCPSPCPVSQPSLILASYGKGALLFVCQINASAGNFSFTWRHGQKMPKWRKLYKHSTAGVR